MSTTQEELVNRILEITEGRKKRIDITELALSNLKDHRELLQIATEGQIRAYFNNLRIDEENKKRGYNSRLGAITLNLICKGEVSDSWRVIANFATAEDPLSMCLWNMRNSRNIGEIKLSDPLVLGLLNRTMTKNAYHSYLSGKTSIGIMVHNSLLAYTDAQIAQETLSNRLLEQA